MALIAEIMGRLKGPVCRPLSQALCVCLKLSDEAVASGQEVLRWCCWEQVEARQVVLSCQVCEGNDGFNREF